MSVIASSLGYPRIGVARELKRALEAYWSKACSSEELQEAAAKLRRNHWLQMKASGIDHIPCNDFSLYDHILDMAVTVKAIPSRYQSITDPLVRYFAMARGIQDKDAGIDLAALEMTKWFDTNYHYIVPELDAEPSFELDASKILAEVKEARALGIDARPVIAGPVTFLLLSKYAASVDTEKSTLELLDKLLPVYQTLLETLASVGVAWVQIDEPCLVTELDETAKRAYRRSFESLCGAKDRPKILLATYFGDLESNLNLAAQSGCDALHIDLVRAPNQLQATLNAIPKTMKLTLGLIDRRNIWRSD